LLMIISVITNLIADLIVRGVKGRHGT